MNKTKDSAIDLNFEKIDHKLPFLQSLNFLQSFFKFPSVELGAPNSTHVSKVQKFLSLNLPQVCVACAIFLKQSRVPGWLATVYRAITKIVVLLDKKYDLYPKLVTAATVAASLMLWLGMLVWSSVWQAVLAYQQTPSFDELASQRQRRQTARSSSPVSRINSFFRYTRSRSSSPFKKIASLRNRKSNFVTLHLGCGSIVRTSTETLAKDEESLLCFLAYGSQHLDVETLDLLAEAGIFPYDVPEAQGMAHWFVDKEPKIFRAILHSLRLYQKTQAEFAVNYLLESVSRSDFNLLKFELGILKLSIFDEQIKAHNQSF